MYHIFSVMLVAAIFLGVGCRGAGEQNEPQQVQQLDPNVPHLHKIPISSPEVADSLIAAGVEVVVVEDAYVVARLEQSKLASLKSEGFESQIASESDLVRRLVRVPVADDSVVSEMASMGFDIWEVREDSVLAQGYDNYIRQLRQQGYAVEIVEENILDLVEKQSAEKK